MEYKIDILNYDDKKLKKWINKQLKMCGKNIKYDDNLLPLFRKSIKKYYKPPIELLFHHPFPYNFGLDENGLPNNKFSKYYNDDILVKKTIHFIALSMYYNNFQIINKVCSDINYSVCIDFNDNILYSKGECLPDVVKNLISKTNEDANKILLDCIISEQNVHIKLGYSGRRKNEKTYEIEHAIGIYLDFKNDKYYLLDSSIKIGNEIRFERNKIIAKLFGNYLNNEFGLKINIKPFYIKETNKCYFIEGSVQGSSGTCSIWTYYSILTHLQNPKMKYFNIYKELIKYTQEERNNLILRFLYHFYTNFKKTIDQWKKYEDIEIPKYTL